MTKQIEKAIDEDKWDKARALIHKELKRDPDNHWLITRLGLTYYEQRQYKRAFKYSKKALALAPDCPLVLWDYANCLDMIGLLETDLGERTEEAISIYKKIIRRGVNRIAFEECGEGLARARGLIADCHYRIALCHLDFGRTGEALVSFKRHLSMRGPGCHSIYPVRQVRKKLKDLVDGMKVRSLPEQGYFVDYSGKKPGKYNHVFCGPHDVKGTDCPNCKKPLLRFLSLDARDKRLEMADMGLKTVDLLYCWTCDVSGWPPFWYQMKKDGSIKILKYNKSNREKDFPYKKYPDYFPKRPARLVKVTARQQKILRKINSGDFNTACKHPDLDEPRHQVGGEPYLVQKWLDAYKCIKCNRRMSLIASIADNCVDPRGFAGNEFVQVLYHLCRKCRIIQAHHEVD